ncbi:MAG: metallophosphoesterase [Proteobacteria bacterium]|nr:metallophosphoesterase [Pseudomonadota bacterium]
MRPPARELLHPRVLVRLLLFAGFVGVAPAAAEMTGVVFEDRDRDGVRDARERGRAGVAVSNGREVVRTDADGRYTLPDGPQGLAFVTRGPDVHAPIWYRPGGGDFGLVRSASSRADESFFVHMSDVHAMDRAGDLLEYSREKDSWVPPRVRAWLWRLNVRLFLEPAFGIDMEDELRRVLAPGSDVRALGNTALVANWFEAIAADRHPLGAPAEQLRQALGEIAALAPAFVVSTGDQILEGNQAPVPVVERWMRFYREEVARLDMPVYDTLGNNELASTELDEVPPETPGHGKASYRAHFGPTVYSFDRAGFHFMALDTHVDASTPGDKDWDFDVLSDDVRAWFENDAAAHPESRRIVLNHEPFRVDPTWPYPSYVLRRSLPYDDGLFARWGVRAVLAGHVHLNGRVRDGSVDHITTGALSGFRWALPGVAYPRGYRLCQVHDGELYTAWKPLGKAALGFVWPATDPGLHATAPALPSTRVVAVAVDEKGPFEIVSLELDGERLPLEPWGRYFFSAVVDRAQVPASGARLVLAAVRANGEEESAVLWLRHPEP